MITSGNVSSGSKDTDKQRIHSPLEFCDLPRKTMKSTDVEGYKRQITLWGMR